MFFCTAGATGGDGSFALPWGTFAEIDFDQVISSGGDITLSWAFTERLLIPSGLATSVSNRLTVIATNASIDVTGQSLYEAVKIESAFVTLDGGSYEGSSGRGIEAVNLDGIEIYRVDSFGHVDEQIYVKASNNSRIQFCTARDSAVGSSSSKGIVAIQSNLLDSKPSQGSIVSDNTIFGIGRQGLQVGGAINGSFVSEEPSGENICVNNKVTGCGAGVKIEAGRYQVFRNNEITDNNTGADTGISISLDSCRNLDIYGNFITNDLPSEDSVYGFFLGNTATSGGAISEDITIRSNLIHCTGNGRDLIRVAVPPRSIEISSNVLIIDGAPTSDYGMFISGFADNATLDVYNNTWVGGTNIIKTSALTGALTINAYNNNFIGSSSRYLDDNISGVVTWNLSNNNYFDAGAADSSIIRVSATQYSTTTISDVDPGAVQFGPIFAGPDTGPIADRDYTTTNELLFGAGDNWPGSDVALDYTLESGYESPPSIGAFGLRFIPNPTGITITGIKGSIGTTTTVNGVTPIGGLSSSIIGVSTNTPQTSDSRVFTEDQVEDHVSAVIGGNDDTINITELEVVTFEPEGATNKHIRYETADAGEVLPDAPFPNGYLNKTNPPVAVEQDESTFSQES